MQEFEKSKATKEELINRLGDEIDATQAMMKIMNAIADNASKISKVDQKR